MTAGEGPLLRERRGPVELLTLNRPERLNAVSRPLYERLAAALREVDGEREVRAVVVTGAGRAFCVGADLKAHGEGEASEEERRAYVRAGQRANRRLQSIGKPVVAAVNGHAIGAGLELALSCDLVLVAIEARLRLPELALGTFVGGGVTYTLPRRVGLGKAKEILLVADFFSGAEAAEMGLADRALPADEVLPAALELAAEVARRAPLPVRHAKRLLGSAPDLGRGEAMAREARALLACMGTRDWREGIRAFHEKREPRFTGE